MFDDDYADNDFIDDSTHFLLFFRLWRQFQSSTTETKPPKPIERKSDAFANNRLKISHHRRRDPSKINIKQE